METDPPPPLKWSSRERSVPEVSIINDSSLKCQSNNFEYMPTFDPLIRKDFPICSSPPIKSTHDFNDSPKFIPPSRSQWTPEAVKTPNLDAFKTELLTAFITHQSNQFDLFKADFLNNIRKEQKAELDDIKNGISLIKSELGNILPSLKHDLFGILEKFKMENKIKPIQKTEIGLQVELEKQDKSIQTEGNYLESENFNCENDQDRNDEYRKPVQRKPHEGFELRLVNDYEKQSNDRNVENVRQSKEYDSDNSEDDDVDDRLSPMKRPMKQYPPDCDMVQIDERYVQGPNQRGGFARVQELRMAGANRHRVIPPEPPQCTDISMATNAVLAKYLPPEKVAECQTPRRQNQPPAQDVVFNMTNVSFAMRYPAENDSPEVGNYIYPPQNRHLKPNRFQDDRYESEEYWKTRNQRRIIEEDEWQTKPPRDILRHHPDWDRFHHGMNKENGMAPGYQDDYNYGRRDGFVRETKWGRGVPYHENFHGRRDPNWENGNNFPMQGRGPPPISNRILDITAIKNQPKLT